MVSDCWEIYLDAEGIMNGYMWTTYSIREENYLQDCIKNLSENRMQTDHLEVPGKDGKTVLNWNLYK
jgi:hypothetical protein